MAPRDIIALKLDRETPKTIRSAIAALAELKPFGKHITTITEMRDDFLQELRFLLDDEAQGALF